MALQPPSGSHSTPLDAVCVSVEEAAQRLGLGASFTWQLVSAGTLRSIKIGKRRLIPVAELDRFVAAQLAAQAEV